VEYIDFNQKLENLLSKNKDLLDQEGILLKQKIKALALSFDEELIGLLLSNIEVKEHFFKEIDKATIFDYKKFIDYIEDKNFLLDSYTKFSNKIGLTVSNKYLKQIDDVVLSFPFKDCILEGGQTKEDEKRKEIFFNEVLAKDEINRLLDKKVIANATKYYYEDHEVQETKEFSFSRDENGTIKDNLIIKGNNLLALHTLKSNFAGKVKLIYIDPPYNTGNDGFKYNDSFNHSTWLTFMRNRLEIARELLSDNGVIAIHLDDNEAHYLKVLMDEIFGREYFINSISIRDSHPSGLKVTHKTKTIIKTKSQIVCYSKSSNILLNPLYQQREDWDTHFNTFVDINSELKQKYSLSNYIKELKIVEKDFKLDINALKNLKFKKFCFENRNCIFQSTKEIPKEAKKTSLQNKNKVIEYLGGDGTRQFALNGRRLSPLAKSIWNIGFDGYEKEDFGKLLCDFWDDIDFNNSQNEGGISLSSGKKPEFLLARVISLFSNKNDIVCDFFAGSGTTGSVSHKIQRQYILIEQMNYINDLPKMRLEKVIEGEKSGISKLVNWQGGGKFIYFELDKYNQKFIDDLSVATQENILDIYSEITKKGFLNYDVELKKLEENFEAFNALSLADKKEFLVSILNKNMLYKNLTEIDDTNFKIDEQTKKLNRDFYNLSDKE